MTMLKFVIVEETVLHQTSVLVIHLSAMQETIVNQQFATVNSVVEPAVPMVYVLLQTIVSVVRIIMVMTVVFHSVLV